MAGPLFMRDVSLTLKVSGGTTRDEYNCDVSTAEIIPTAGSKVDYSTLCSDGSYSNVGKTTYELHIVAAQRWAVDGLAAFLWDHDGELAEFQYQAHSETAVPAPDAPGMAGEVRLVAGNYGGAVDTYAELDVTLPCTSKPDKIVAAFPAMAAADELELAAAS